MADKNIQPSISNWTKGFIVMVVFIILAGSGCKNASTTPPVENDLAATSLPTVIPLPTATAFVEEKAASSLIVPLGSSPIIDGTRSPGEWGQAIVETFSDGSQLFLMQAGDFLYVGIKANEFGTIAVNVFVQCDDEISILHSSAALGSAVYKKGGDSWQQVRDFSWCCRDTGNSEVAQAERTEFLQNEGWLAANGLMGTPNEFEYQIKIPDQDFCMAVVYIKSTYPYEKVPWPASLGDDCIAPSSGELPLEMQFALEQWVELELSR